jgi:hypothetical protein
MTNGSGAPASRYHPSRASRSLRALDLAGRPPRRQIVLSRATQPTCFAPNPQGSNRGGGEPEMRVSHFVDIVIVIAFVAAYQFNAEPRFSELPANQLGTKIQGPALDSAPAKKADRLVPNEEEEGEDQLFSPILVRLEKYDLPTDDDLKSPKQSHLSYLADYTYSEVPPDKKPADIVLDSLKDIQTGTPIEEIKRASDAFGLDFNFMKTVAKIESDFDAKQRTGSYLGLFQLSKDEFAVRGIFLMLATTPLPPPTSSLPPLSCSN